MLKIAVLVAAGTCTFSGSATAPATSAYRPSPAMSFFVTSVGAGKGGDFGGLKGADRHCQQLAAKVGAGGREWRAYLSTRALGEQPAADARDRIGQGPWANAHGDLIARNVDELHETARTLWQVNLSGRRDRNNVASAYALDERGAPLGAARAHSVLTGSRADGTGYEVGRDLTCRNWTSNADGDVARQGNVDRSGPGQAPDSWNSAGNSAGCSAAALSPTGKDGGLLYCFARR
jgi:hypothetical protein